jgi:uncharacterized protein YbjT (DUF2867 family)
MSTSQTILVIRATGTQGSAACAHLHRLGHNIHALVTDPSEARSQALSKFNAKIFPGTIDNRAAVDKAIAGCTGLYIALMPLVSDPEGSEPRQARLLIEAANAAGVNHVVISTSMSVDRPEKLGAEPGSIMAKFLGWKLETERLVQDAGFETWTVLRPGYFMSNFLWPLNTFMFPE